MHFSIVIPTRNRCLFLESLLKNISRLEYDKNKIELIVVDNRSIDDTRKIVKIFIKNNPKLTTYYLYKAEIGPSYARNSGIKKAKFSHVVCIDDDVLIEKDLLLRLASIFERHPKAALVGGKNIAISPYNKRLEYFMKLLNKDVWVFAHTVRKEKSVSELQYPDMLMSACICINRNVFDGFFSENFGREYGNFMIFAEDTELCFRLILEGKIVIYDPSLVSKHVISENKLTFKYILKRFYQTGVEQRILDDMLSKKGLSMIFQKNLYEIYGYVKLAMKLKNIECIVVLAKEITLLLGYKSLRAKEILKEINLH
ncbi:MAG TPA: glycosyltransferase [Patescibacteria group bacterium]|nr:glycosyltransferase [Patescibacteria group bacterium]